MLYQHLPLLFRGFLTPRSGIRIRDDKKSGSGINIQDIVSKSLETVFGLKILKYFDANPDPESF
jgi:hypothetical protein